MITSKDMEGFFLEALRDQINGKEGELRSLRKELDEKEHELFVESAASVIRKMVKVIKDAGLSAKINCQQWNYTITDGERSATFNARTFDTE